MAKASKPAAPVPAETPAAVDAAPQAPVVELAPVMEPKTPVESGVEIVEVDGKLRRVRVEKTPSGGRYLTYLD